MPKIGLATTPTDVAAVKTLFTEYLRFVEAFLGASLDFQGTAKEFADFPQTYDGLLLATLDDAPVGACGIKPFKGDICELKRLYVSPQGRGHGLGEALTRAAIASARDHGYATIYLDTNPGLTHANAVYERLGFKDISSYYDNPLGDASRYMKLDFSGT